MTDRVEIDLATGIERRVPLSAPELDDLEERAAREAETEQAARDLRAEWDAAASISALKAVLEKVGIAPLSA